MPTKPAWVISLLAALALAIGMFMHFGARRSKSSDGMEGPAKVESPTSSTRFQPRAVAPSKDMPEPMETSVAGPLQLPRERVEDYLARHHRSAASLLAALHAMNDTNYLNEAATNFPNDPQVQWTILARNSFPEDRRKWLDAFTSSSPSNSLANYLSAQDYFKNGQTDTAVNELQAATGKTHFDSYETESRLDIVELGMASGKSQLESDTLAMAGISPDFLGEFQTFRQLAIGAADLQKQEFAAGDTAAAGNLAQMGIVFADQIRNGDSGKYLMNHLLGNLNETIVLHELDPNTSYDFLDGKTPTQRLDELKRSKTELKALTASFSSIFPTLTEAEKNSYSQRSKIYGELEAIRWLNQRYPAAIPNTGN